MFPLPLSVFDCTVLREVANVTTLPAVSSKSKVRNYMPMQVLVQQTGFLAIHSSLLYT